MDVDRAGASCAGRPCWTPIGKQPPLVGVGYTYRDRNAAADGIDVLQLKGRRASRRS